MHDHVLGPGAFLQRLAVATVLGLIIGFERQWRQRSAGLHTSTIVAIGAALFTSVPELAGATDTMRLAAAVTQGIGFLAGGVILRDGFNVRGLITAATLWATAAVGVLAGAGFLFQAMVGALVILCTNLVCMPLANVISRIPRAAADHRATTYTVRVSCSEAARTAVRDRILHEIDRTSLSLASLVTSTPAHHTIDVVAEMTTVGVADRAVDRLQASVTNVEGVTAVSWESAERPI